MFCCCQYQKGRGIIWIIKVLFIIFIIKYTYLYIENKDEDEVASLMGFKTTEKNRAPGYKQIKNLKKSIIKKAS